MMDRQDQEALRAILITWYGPQAQQWSMNEALLKVVVKMVDEMHVCTSAMHFVPRPLGRSGTLSQLAKSYVKTQLLQ
jgi:hypothetical protein